MCTLTRVSNIRHSSVSEKITLQKWLRATALVDDAHETTILSPHALPGAMNAQATKLNEKCRQLSLLIFISIHGIIQHLNIIAGLHRSLVKHDRLVISLLII